ncbi:hypothetical protein AAKU67_004119 [Oxalobacteraceae bacterium GrIS 2.11]
MEKIKEMACGQGLSMADYIRRAALKRDVVEHYDPVLVSELNEITNFLNTLSKENRTAKKVPPSDVFEFLKNDASDLMKKIADSK